ncbi:RDD family protein [Rhodovulum tesquicola]|uniref:RDD family protein n=1 Tax=Rhodovulum tesquicola TaxID=540254 RepID=UPI002097E1D1|nr:RDD family protein [Rhodovulum tesquicola]MCO8144526.1 RDD family protein [Rhodovulum tesquicola]
MTDQPDPLWGLPDPVLHAEFYRNVPAKRLVAWVVDTVLILLIALLALPFTAFAAVFVLPLFVALVGFVYRVVTLARGSATWGMRLMAIEIRNGRGERLDSQTAALHTLVYSLGMAFVLPQVVSVVLMLTGARAQGLHDMLLGTAAINRPARF